MNQHGYHCSPAPKRKQKKKHGNKKLGVLMLLLGAITIMALFLPLKCWVLILSFALIVLGIDLCSH